MSERQLPDLMMTVKEFAQQIRCGTTKAKRLLKEGWVPSVMIDGHRRIRWSDYVAKVESLPVDEVA